MKRTIEDLNDLQGKVVLLRVDFNVPISDNTVTDSTRIKAALPTIEALASKGARVVLFSHLGRIKSEEDKKDKSLKVVSEKLAELINKPVKFVPKTRGIELEDGIKNLGNGELLMFENTRFEDVVDGEHVQNESKNNEELGKYWASLGHIFVNDAFATAHRKHASNVGIATYIETSALGYLMAKEEKYLGMAVGNPERPFVALIGGAKVSDKIEVLQSILNKADKVIVGGGMAFTFWAAEGKKIGTSLFEADKVELAKSLLEKYSDKLYISEDAGYVDGFKDETPEYGTEIPDGYMGLDAGPKTIESIKNIVKGAKTVVWNGPFGVTEFKNFEIGTQKIAEALGEEDAITIVGGGDSVAAINKLGLESKFTHISTGGGSSLEYLEGKELPGISSIQDK